MTAKGSLKCVELPRIRQIRCSEQSNLTITSWRRRRLSDWRPSAGQRVSLCNSARGRGATWKRARAFVKRLREKKAQRLKVHKVGVILPPTCLSVVVVSSAPRAAAASLCSRRSQATRAAGTNRIESSPRRELKGSASRELSRSRRATPQREQRRS